jgi:2-isopropylmalate synthase
MTRRIEIFDTTLRDGNKLPFAVLSAPDRIVLARQLARLGVDVIEAGFPAADDDESECVLQACREVEGPYIAALARALESDVAKALECLESARRPYLHMFMSVSPQFLAQVLKEKEEGALRNLSACIRMARSSTARVQFSLSEAPHARREFLREVCLAAREAGAEVINLADTNGILAPEDLTALVEEVQRTLGAEEMRQERPGAPIIGVHCHNDLGLATANTLAALRAGASHAEVTIGGFGERSGNAALEEVAFLISAFGERYGLSHGIRLEEIARTARLFESLTGIRTHPNKPVIGQCAFVPASGGFAGKSLDPGLRKLLQEKTIGRTSGDEALPAIPEEPSGPYALESFNVLTSSHSPPVGVVVIRREGKSLPQTSHGTGPIDALFRAVDKALGFSTRMVLYSVSTLSTGSEALAEVIVTVELRGRRFHGRHTSADVIEASLRAYLHACNAIGVSRILEGPADFHVTGEYLWE